MAASDIPLTMIYIRIFNFLRRAKNIMHKGLDIGRRNPRRTKPDGNFLRRKIFRANSLQSGKILFAALYFLIEICQPEKFSLFQCRIKFFLPILPNGRPFLSRTIGERPGVRSVILLQESSQIMDASPLLRIFLLAAFRQKFQYGRFITRRLLFHFQTQNIHSGDDVGKNNKSFRIINSVTDAKTSFQNEQRIRRHRIRQMVSGIKNFKIFKEKRPILRTFYIIVGHIRKTVRRSFIQNPFFRFIFRNVINIIGMRRRNQ